MRKIALVVSIFIVLALCLASFAYINQVSDTKPVELDTNQVKEFISCRENLDCPSQMKCEDSVCVDVGCVGEGEMLPGPIAPEYREHQAQECCEGLKGIEYSKHFDESCKRRPWAGGPGAVCSQCGNGSCEEWETKCNCPRDCK